MQVDPIPADALEEIKSVDPAMLLQFMVLQLEAAGHDPDEVSAALLGEIADAMAMRHGKQVAADRLAFASQMIAERGPQPRATAH